MRQMSAPGTMGVYAEQRQYFAVISDSSMQLIVLTWRPGAGVEEGGEVGCLMGRV